MELGKDEWKALNAPEELLTAVEPKDIMLLRRI